MSDISPFPRIEQIEFPAMGTVIGIFLVVHDAAACDRARADFSRVRAIYVAYEKIFSRFDPQSELSRLNGCLGSEVAASIPMCSIASRALHFHHLSEGLFDPRIFDALVASGYAHDFDSGGFSKGEHPEGAGLDTDLGNDLIVGDGTVRFLRRMDFSGIVKGHVTDMVAQFLSGQGWTDFMVDSGGDMRLAGMPAGAEQWNIALEGADSSRVLICATDAAIATSGISKRKWSIGHERFHHLVNPRNPEAYDFSLRTVTVIAGSAEEADILAKTIFIQPDDRRRAFVRERGISAIVLSYSGQVWISPGAKPLCRLA